MKLCMPCCTCGHGFTGQSREACAGLAVWLCSGLYREFGSATEAGKFSAMASLRHTADLLRGLFWVVGSHGVQQGPGVVAHCLLVWCMLMCRGLRLLLGLGHLLELPLEVDLDVTEVAGLFTGATPGCVRHMGRGRCLALATAALQALQASRQ